MLDKGQREDWFSSHFIQIFSAVAVAGLLGFVVWEMREQHPVLNLRLLKNRNFAVSNVLMFTLGWVLYGTTVLIPQFLQTVHGIHRATCRHGAFSRRPGRDGHDAHRGHARSRASIRAN